MVTEKPILTQERLDSYLKEIETVLSLGSDDISFDIFADFIKRIMNDLYISDQEISSALNLGLPTCAFWRKGLATPSKSYRPFVCDFLKAKITEYKASI